MFLCLKQFFGSQVNDPTFLHLMLQREPMVRALSQEIKEP